MASGNSAASAARQNNVAFQFPFYQHNVYHITVDRPRSSTSEREDIDLWTRVHEQIVQREAGLMARYARCLHRLMHGLGPINANLLDPNHVLFIAKRLLEEVWEHKKGGQLVAPLQTAKVQLYVDKLKKLLIWLEAIVKLALDS